MVSPLIRYSGKRSSHWWTWKVFGWRNFRKHRDIKNVEQYITLDISSKIDFLYKRKFNSSESKYYMEIPVKCLTTYLYISIEMLNKKQKSRFTIADITNQDFRKLLKKFNNSPYLCYKSKQVHNKPTEAHFFQIKHFTKLMKTKRHIWIPSKLVKWGIWKKRQQNNWTRQQSNKF